MLNKDKNSLIPYKLQIFIPSFTNILLILTIFSFYYPNKKKLDPTLQRNLRINIEKKNQGEDLTKEIEIKDEQMQKVKGIFPYFEKYSEEAILNHVV